MCAVARSIGDAAFARERKCRRVSASFAWTLAWTLAAITSSAHASTSILGTQVGGTIGNETWTSAGSPYRVVAPIAVAQGAQLTIEPGVDVLFDLDVPFEVHGVINAAGTGLDSVRFLPGKSPRWAGLKIRPGSVGSTIVNARISGGYSYVGGGLSVGSEVFSSEAPALARSSIEVVHSVISGNSSRYAGGGVSACGEVDLKLRHCTIAKNRSDYSTGGIIGMWQARVLLDQCEIVGNMAGTWAGGAKFDNGAHGILLNCTIAENEAPEIGSEGISLNHGSATISNSILWGNDRTQGIMFDETSHVDVTYSDVGMPESLFPGEGNINANPVFVDAENGDYRLDAASPCVDAGDPNMPDHDGSRADMGANPLGGLAQTGGTLVAGDVTRDQWTPAGSPYRIAGSTRIPPGHRLTIHGGVEIQFDADVPFVIEGSLFALGNALDSIRFVAGQSRTWVGLRFTQADSSLLRYVRVSGAYAPATVSRPIGRTFGLSVTPTSSGGGISVEGAETRLALDHCTIRENRVRGDGAGISVSGNARLWATSCAIIGNEATKDGGGLHVTDGAHAIVSRCVVAKNLSGATGGGISVSDGGIADVQSCTIVANGSSLHTGGLHVGLNARAELTNSIVWANTPSSAGRALDAVLSVRYSDVEPVSLDLMDVVLVDGSYPGDGLIGADPLLADIDAGDYRLSYPSPCVDAGDPEAGTDPDGTTLDIGAFPLGGGVPPSGTAVSGAITTRRWEKSKSPYHIVGETHVPSGNVLTIEAGVDVVFDTDVRFAVDGALRALGALSDSVRFLAGVAREWGGIRIVGGEPSTFRYVRISGASAYDANGWPGDVGGGLGAVESRVELSDCVISGNTASDGGGLAVIGSTVSLTRCAVVRNVAKYDGAGIYVASGGQADLQNCTVHCRSGGALYVSGSTVSVNSSILWTDTREAIHTSTAHDLEGLTVDYSVIRGGASGAGNMDADPMLVRGFRLDPGSPCVDTGNPSRFDIDGTRLDVGAYALHTTPLNANSLTASNASGNPGDVVAVTVSLEAARTRLVSLAIAFDPALLEPVASRLVSAHAFEGITGGECHAQVRDNTVFVLLSATEDIRSVGTQLVALQFRIKPDAPRRSVADLSFLPYPATSVSGEPAQLTNGAVRVVDLRYGDVSGDGTISTFDAGLILQWRVRLLDNIDHEKGDVTGNGETTSHDAALITQWTLDPTVVFPVSGDVGYRLTSSDTKLSWRTDGSAWVLVAEGQDPVVSGDFVFALPPSVPVRVTSRSMMEKSTEGVILRVALVHVADANPELLRMTPGVPLSEPPRLMSAMVNEQRLTLSEDVLIHRFALAQNAPNPFNPTTTIRYSLGEPAHVVLEIFAPNGQLVRVLTDRAHVAGTHELLWDGIDSSGRPVASGMYVYRLTSTDTRRSMSAIRRMTLVR